jgi:hypothetical protein
MVDEKNHAMDGFIDNPFWGLRMGSKLRERIAEK